VTVPAGARTESPDPPSSCTTITSRFQLESIEGTARIRVFHRLSLATMTHAARAVRCCRAELAAKYCWNDRARRTRCASPGTDWRVLRGFGQGATAHGSGGQRAPPAWLSSNTIGGKEFRKVVNTRVTAPRSLSDFRAAFGIVVLQTLRDEAWPSAGNCSPIDGAG